MNGVGEPCAGESHARFDGRELDTERADHGREEERQGGKPQVTVASRPTVRHIAIEPAPTLPMS